MPYTLKELSDKLAAFSGETPETLNRQIRSWTEAGAMPLVGDLFIGTGKSRLYEDDAVLLGIVGIELAKWGLPIGKLRLVLAAMYAQMNVSGLSKLGAIRDGSSDALVMLSPSRNDRGIHVGIIERANLSAYAAGEGGPPAHNVILLDLHALWAPLR